MAADGAMLLACAIAAPYMGGSPRPRNENARPPCIDRRMAGGRLRTPPIDPATLKSVWPDVS
jgi:hypothetical protein